MAKESPEPSLDPVEALQHIRTIIEVTAEQAYGTPAEPAFREIRNVLNKALPPRVRQGPTGADDSTAARAGTSEPTRSPLDKFKSVARNLD